MQLNNPERQLSGFSHQEVMTMPYKKLIHIFAQILAFEAVSYFSLIVVFTELLTHFFFHVTHISLSFCILKLYLEPF